MGLSGIFNALAHRVDGGGEHAQANRTRGPSRWLVYGIAAVVLLYVLGRATMLVGLGNAGTGTGQPGGSQATGAPNAGTAGTATAAAAGQAATGAGTPRYYETLLAAELEALLGRVQGAGRVAVSVSLVRGPSYVFGHNTTSDTRETEERDSSGSTRTVREATTSQQPVILRDNGTGERPLITEEERPGVAGVVILAEGAADSTVRLNLVRAVQALFELPAHRITVLPMGR